MTNRTPEKYITAYYEDDGDLKSAIKSLQEKNVNIHNVYTPFPVHGLEHVLKYPKSNLPKVGFVAGVTGATCALSFQIWVFTQDWPLNIGGKPFLSIPSFIPVTFELTVLFAAFAMAIVYFIRCGIGPGASNTLFNDRQLDDQFQIVIDAEQLSDQEIEQYSNYIIETGGKEVTVK